MKRTRRTTRGAAIIGAIALIGAGCGDEGGGDAPVEIAEPAVFPAKVADELAKRSDEVGAKLEAGDLCGAAHTADDLAREAERAGSEIPAELQAELEQGIEQLVNTVNCPPPPEKKPKKDKDEDEDDEGDSGYGDEEIFGEGDGESGPGNSGNAPGHNRD
jgi:hypothetical protein